MKVKVKIWSEIELCEICGVKIPDKHWICEDCMLEKDKMDMQVVADMKAVNKVVREERIRGYNED